MNEDAADPARLPSQANASSEACGMLLATLPLSRVGALLRGMLWFAGAVTLWIIASAIYRLLVSAPTGAASAIVNISIAVISLPIPIAAFWVTVQAMRWSLTGLWPKHIEVAAYEKALVLRLGPFGTKRLDTERLEVNYPFELDSEDGGFEQFLPEQEQMATLLPRLTHPEVREPINQLLVRFAGADERSITAILRPAFDHWRECVR